MHLNSDETQSFADEVWGEDTSIPKARTIAEMGGYNIDENDIILIDFPDNSAYAIGSLDYIGSVSNEPEYFDHGYNLYAPEESTRSNKECEQNTDDVENILAIAALANSRLTDSEILGLCKVALC
jgi:hypothetical protein